MTTEDLIAVLKKHPIGVVCGLVTIICGALLYLRSGNIAASQTELEASSAQAKMMIANVRNSAGLEDQLAEIQTLGKEIDGRMMKAGQLAVNLQYFYKLETENEVKLIDVRQNTFPRNIKSAYAGVPFSVSVQGTYKNVMNFLNRLQNGRHFCRVNSAIFSKTGETSGQITLSLNLELLGQP